MIHRQTQTHDYWSAFRFTQDDCDYISNVLLEDGKPKPTSDLAMLVIKHRVDVEEAGIRRDLEQRTIYQPRKSYAIGEEIVFPALKLTTGVVVEKRAGNNPDKSPFDVIAVEMKDGKRREFASNYAWSHRLNDDNVLAALNDDSNLDTPAQLHEYYGEVVGAAIDESLSKNTDFLRIANEWFLRVLMAEVNIGHLHLAEAVLDVAAGGPLDTATILQELGLPPDIAGSLQEISLNTALATDERFDDVSLSETRAAWFLRRLEPSEVRSMPNALRPSRFNGDRTISEELRTLSSDLDDELLRDAAAEVQTQQSTSLVLGFSHRRAGTLGWSTRVAGILPNVGKPRLPITFEDKATHKQFVVWLVKDGWYIYGLSEWYKQNDLPTGAYLELSRGPADNIVMIDYKRRKPKREWVRVATNRDGHLRLETAQRAVACEFDEHMSVFVDNPLNLDSLRGDSPRDVAQAVRESFPEIAKLSPQGNVHARTLYAVVNVITRASPVDVFAALTSSGQYVPVGDNYWHLSEAR